MIVFLKLAGTLGSALVASMALAMSGWSPPWLF